MVPLTPERTAEIETAVEITGFSLAEWMDGTVSRQCDDIVSAAAAYYAMVEAEQKPLDEQIRELERRKAEAKEAALGKFRALLRPSQADGAESGASAS